MAQRRYIVRGGIKNGKYITLSSRNGARKYAWSNVKYNAITLTYEQARGVTRRYGGEIVTA